MSPTATHDYAEHESADVPAPIPDTGLPPPTTLVRPPTRPHAPPFVPLPSLKTLNLTAIEDAASRSSAALSTQSAQSPLPTASRIPHDTQPNASRLSTPATVALAVGAGITLLVLVILIKLVKRPRRRRTPTPSLPILHDGAFPDDQGSPIFGGKECSSPPLHPRGPKGNTGLWTWTQYNSGIPKPTPMATVIRSSPQNQYLNPTQTAQRDGLSDDASVHGPPRGQYPFVGYRNSISLSKPKTQTALQPVQNAITRAVSRLSMVSMSLYPNSPAEYSQVGADVGLAIDGVPRDEPADLVGPKYKDKSAAFPNRTSVTSPGTTKDPAALRRSQSFAYGGMVPISPPNVSANRTQSNGGRARIKSTYYTPGAYPRVSTAAMNYNKQNVDRGHDRTQHRIERADSRRGKDLTSALGLTSPIPPSPQPTLYPDDSMSVIGEAKKVTITGRSQKKPVPQCDSPPSDPAALGSLMMVDFAASKSTASLVNIRPCEAARARLQGVTAGSGQAVSGSKKRVEDKPPRVPSPPPIPSLAQMALQHADPEGYADYHSPTYSIYGLYNGDRKSRGLSYGY